MTMLNISLKQHYVTKIQHKHTQEYLSHSGTINH